MRRIASLGLLLSTVSVAHADPGAFRGPYLNDVRADGITVLWESPTPTTGVVHYGVNSPNEMTAASSTPALHHEVRLIGLSGMAPPGSQFVYELEVDGQRYPGSFYTAVQGDTPFSFLVYGDNRSSEPQHTAVVDALLAEMSEARFIMSTGDMVSDGDDESHWDTYFQIEAPFLARMPVYLAIGNHEVDSLRWDIGQRVFAPPTDVMPASNDEAFFHFIYGNVQLIVINAEVDGLFTGLLSFLAGDQEDWLEEVLDNRPPGVRHRFVFIHKGPYSSKRGRTGNFWLRQWLDDLKAADVNVIISGHDHYAERGFAENGLHYLIHGGGGAPLYDTLGPRVVNDHSIIYSESRLGYVLVSIDGPRAEFEIKALDGTVVDRFVYGDQAMPECASETDCGAPPVNGCPGGSWECAHEACRFTCDSGMGGLITCFTDRQCENMIGAQCPGTAVCESPSNNPLDRYCRCDVPPECTMASDCAGRPPPIPGCVGTWDCMDDVCEFLPDSVCDEPDAGMSMPDADVADATAPDASTSAEDATTADAATADATSPSDAVVADDAASANDATAPATDAGVVAGDDAEVDAGPAPTLPVAEDNCSCAATAERSRMPWGLALVLLPFVRRR